MSKLKEFFEPKETKQQPKPEEPESDEEFKQTCRFVAQMVVQAQSYGASIVRVQSLLAKLPQIVGFRGQMLAAPPLLFFEFWRPTNSEPYRLSRPFPESSFDLTKLSSLGLLVSDLQAGQVSIDEASVRLKQIDSLPAPYNSTIMALGYSLCGAGFAVLLSAAWFDVLLSAVLSLVVFAITLYAGHSQWLANRINFFAALVTSVLANLVALLLPGSDPFTVALCAVVVLVPGLALTLGFAELASKSVISGMDRLIDGVLITLALVVGSALGSSIVNALWTVPSPAATRHYSLIAIFASVILLMLGLSLIFQVPRRDLGWVILAGVVAYSGVLLGRPFGDWQGSFFGALFLSFYTELISDRLRLPASIILLPGIMILVPGVAAYFGVGALQTRGIYGALPTVWGVLIQIVAIIGGLYVAASIMPQKSDL